MFEGSVNPVSFLSKLSSVSANPLSGKLAVESQEVNRFHEWQSQTVNSKSLIKERKGKTL